MTSELPHRVWDYDEGALTNVFENHNAADKGVSRLCLLNELDDSLLLVASSKNWGQGKIYMQAFANEKPIGVLVHGNVDLYRNFLAN